MELYGETISDIYPDLLSAVLHEGVEVESRGMKVREITNFTFTLEDVNYPLVLQAERKLNYAYAVLEPFLLTMPQTFAVVEACEFYVGKFLKKNVIDPKTGKMQGFYGDKINWNGRNQLLEVYEILKKDPGSRRAVVTIHDSKQELFSNTGSIDVPCTLELQFMIRDGALDCYVNMRGNDVMLGTPQNVAMWTFFQRMLAKWLDVATGKYVHHVNSLHLYERDVEKAIRIVNNQTELMEEYNFSFDWEISDPLTSLKMCEKFVENEKTYRASGKTEHVTHSLLGRLAKAIIFPHIDKKRQAAIKRTGNPYANLESTME